MPIVRFTPRQLDAFVAVAQLRSFRAAGESLGLSTSAISQLVAELEEAVGFRLFDRSTRSVALSSAGREFLGPAQSVLRQITLADGAAADVRHRAAGVVRVAAPLAIASTLLPAAMEDFARERPKVVVRILDTAVEQLADAVAHADADLAVGPDRAVGEAVQRSAIFTSPWVLWCAPSHPLARHDSLRWPDLHPHALVAAGRDHESSVVQMRANAYDDPRSTPIEVVSHLTTAMGLAARGLRATLAPAYVESLARSFGLVLRHVIEPEVMREVSLYRPTGRATSPAAEAFAEHLAAWLQAWSLQQRWQRRGRRVTARAAPR